MHSTVCLTSYTRGVDWLFLKILLRWQSFLLGQEHLSVRVLHSWLTVDTLLNELNRNSQGHVTFAAQTSASFRMLVPVTCFMIDVLHSGDNRIPILPHCVTLFM